MAESKFKPFDIIILTLTLVNIFVIVPRGLLHTLTAFAIKKLLNDYGCKLVIYTFRVCRGMSMCSTCLLSCSQAVTIAPSTNQWVKLKRSVLLKTVLSLSLLWSFNLTFWCSRLLYTSAEMNTTVHTYVINSDFCFVIFPTYSHFIGFGTSATVYDFCCVILMALSSGYIVLSLYQHRKKMKTIRRNKTNSQENAPETQAAKVVVTLVMFYVTIFSTDNIVFIYSNFAPSVPPIFADIRMILALSYAAFSPIIIIKASRKIQTKFKCRKKKNEMPISNTCMSISVTEV
ncbi:olfactory receptor class A-like protein 1 [Protopterus annectens]|uniref:olfactory receptor class A-like protein 1 n=1 Tax=Protopterus annectens TaxID=7888 RepID=UPI001CFBE073|nr:olfactory receptor class A-like protein 1 [Protopterus annectens]